MKNQPPVSIHIITYMNSAERGQVLKRTCEAALAQRYPDFEVIVADNGGSYSAKEALASIDDPRLKVHLNKENSGFSGNINLCLEYCTHDIIKPLCDDDLIHPDFLNCTVPHVDDDTLVMVSDDLYQIGSDPAEMKEEIREPCTYERRPAGYQRDQWTLSYAPFPSDLLFTRKFFEDLGGYDLCTIISDWDFFIEACIYKSIVHIDQTLCWGGVWSGSLTVQMEERPYFFPHEGLYTKFRVLRCKALPRGDQMHLAALILKDMICQCLRVLKHGRKQAYREGFKAYMSSLAKLARQDRGAFGARPNQSI